MASIEKRGENSWRLTVETGYDGKGKRLRERRVIVVEDKALLKTTKKLREYLEERLHEFKMEIQSGMYVKPEKTTFAEFVDKHWYPKYANDADNLSPVTLDVYQRHLKVYILPYFGHRKLDAIQPMHVVDFVALLKSPDSRKIKKGENDCLSGHTQIYILRVLVNVLSRAVEWKFLKVNPAAGVRKPKIPATTVGVYDEDEIKAIMEALKKETDMWRLLLLTTFLGGFRRGEVIALEFSDLNFDDNTITIDENIPMKINKKHIIKPPKNKSSARKTKMPEWLMQQLEKYVEAWQHQRELVGDKWLGGDRQFLFHAGFGVPYEPTSVTIHWRNFLKKNGFRHIKLHGLRHTSATFLLEQGLTTRAVAERLGHVNERTLISTYSHVTKKMEERAAQEFDKFNCF